MEKLNIAELLKDCPKGIELDCTMCDNVYLDEVTPQMIKCYIKNDVSNTIYFHHDGTYLTTQNAKCVIFPKGKTTWEGFQRPFKDGDVVVCEDGNSIQMFILKFQNGDNRGYCYTGYDFNLNSFFNKGYWNFHRLATSEEKQKLFQAIKDNGYRWNNKTKTLEKLPKFEVGDKVKRKDDNYTYIVTIAKLDGDYYNYVNEDGQCGVIHISTQDAWELVPIIPKFKVRDRITNGKVSITIGYIDDNYYYETGRKLIQRVPIEKQDDWRLDKFDITPLKPFESRVLVRNIGAWEPAFWGYYSKEYAHPFVVAGGNTFAQCVPYEENQHLLGTTNDCDDFYKTWE